MRESIDQEWFVLNGAHTTRSANVLSTTLREIFPDEAVVLIVAIWQGTKITRHSCDTWWESDQMWLYLRRCNLLIDRSQKVSYRRKYLWLPDHGQGRYAIGSLGEIRDGFQTKRTLQMSQNSFYEYRDSHSQSQYGAKWSPQAECEVSRSHLCNWVFVYSGRSTWMYFVVKGRWFVQVKRCRTCLDTAISLNQTPMVGYQYRLSCRDLVVKWITNSWKEWWIQTTRSVLPKYLYREIIK